MPRALKRARRCSSSSCDNLEPLLFSYPASISMFKILLLKSARELAASSLSAMATSSSSPSSGGVSSSSSIIMASTPTPPPATVLPEGPSPPAVKACTSL
eukprot:scaffold1293_cov375-Prasinococcus_capsulatus_cf.AAC.14